VRLRHDRHASAVDQKTPHRHGLDTWIPNPAGANVLPVKLCPRKQTLGAALLAAASWL
jgi:hypothetical protein